MLRNLCKSSTNINHLLLFLIRQHPVLVGRHNGLKGIFNNGLLVNRVVPPLSDKILYRGSLGDIKYQVSSISLLNDKYA
jgi:hypothetical protein